MTIDTPATTSGKRAGMDPMRKTAFVAGGLYLLTFITSIPALALKDTVRHNTNFVLGAGTTSGVMWAGVLDVACALAGIGSALALYRVVKRHSETAALGFLASRIVEGTIMVVGVISLLAIVTLRHDVAGTAGTSPATLVTIARALVAVHEWTFLLGPGLMAGVNALFLGSVMYRSRLIPRIIPTLGLVGAPLIIGSAAATMFGAWTQTSFLGSSSAALVALWELSLGLWLVAKGFTASALPDDTAGVPGALALGGLAA